VRKLALIIAARTYRDQRFPELPGAAEDAVQLTSVLSDTIISEFTVETLVDEAASTVMRRMEMFFRRAEHDDVLDPLRHLFPGAETVFGDAHGDTVALGAALQAGVLNGEVKDVLPLEVTALSLGIETRGGVFTKLIDRNTTIPVKRSEIITTADDNQDQIKIQVYQGDQPMAADNTKLGTFELTGLSPAPRGTVQIEVTFDINSDGVHVSAKDLATGTDQSLSISGNSALSGDDIQRMRDEIDRYPLQH